MEETRVKTEKGTIEKLLWKIDKLWSGLIAKAASIRNIYDSLTIRSTNPCENY